MQTAFVDKLVSQSLLTHSLCHFETFFHSFLKPLAMHSTITTCWRLGTLTTSLLNDCIILSKFCPFSFLKLDIYFVPSAMQIETRLRSQLSHFRINCQFQLLATLQPNQISGMKSKRCQSVLTHSLCRFVTFLFLSETTNNALFVVCRRTGDQSFERLCCVKKMLPFQLFEARHFFLFLCNATKDLKNVTTQPIPGQLANTVASNIKS